jgi:hypothetical protein
MTVIGRLVAIITAHTAGFNGGVKQAQDSLASLNQSFKGFNAGARLLVGAGALAGMTMVARKIGEVAGAVAQAKTDLATGKISLEEYSDTIASMAPLVGPVITMSQKLGDAIYGVSAAKAVLERGNSLADLFTELNRQAKLVNLSGPEKQIEELDQRFRQTIKRLQSAATGATPQEQRQVNAEIQIAEQTKNQAILNLGVAEEAKQLKAVLEAARQAGQENQARIAGEWAVVAAVREQVDTYGMTARQVAIFRMQRKAEAGLEVEAAVEELKVQTDLLDKLDLENKAREKGLTFAQKAKDDAVSRLESEWEVVDSLRQQAAVFGMTSRQAALFKMAQDPNTQAALKEAQAQSALLDALERNAQAHERGKQLFEETRTPLERYAEDLNQLGELLDQGAVSWETYQRKARMLREGLPDLAATYHPVAALERGTAAAYSAERRAEATSKPSDIDRQALEIEKQQLAQLRMLNDSSGQTLEVVKIP